MILILAILAFYCHYKTKKEGCAMIFFFFGLVFSAIALASGISWAVSYGQHVRSISEYCELKEQIAEEYAVLNELPRESRIYIRTIKKIGVLEENRNEAFKESTQGDFFCIAQRAWAPWFDCEEK